VIIEVLYLDGCPNHGKDIEPGVRSAEDLALGCRVYDRSGVPPRELLVDAIRGAASTGGSS
jgi:hypothetical protein